MSEWPIVDYPADPLTGQIAILITGTFPSGVAALIGIARPGVMTVRGDSM